MAVRRERPWRSGRCCVLRLCSPRTRPTYDVQARTDAARRGAGSAVLARFPADQRRPARLASSRCWSGCAGAQGEQRQQVRLIAAVGRRWSAVGLVCLFVVQSFNGGQQTWPASLPLFVVVLPAADPVRGRRAALPALRPRGDHQPDRRPGDRHGRSPASATPRSSSPSGGWSTSRPAGSGCPCWPPRSSRSPSSRCAARSSGSPTGWPTARGPSPTRRSSDFSRRLAETPSADTLLPAVAEAAGRAVVRPGRDRHPRRRRARAPSRGLGRRRGGRHRRARGPGRDDGSADLGSIAVRVPRGRRLRRSDERLLTALADQTAVAFRNAALEAQLADHVAELDRTTHELAALAGADHRGRRRRPPDPRGRHLARGAAAPVALPDGIAERRAAVAAGRAANRHRRASSTSTNTALEALRELTRGVFPTQLARPGSSRRCGRSWPAAGSPRTLRVDPSAAGRRFSARVEAAVYFCCAEAARTVAGPDGRRAVPSTADELVLRVPVAPARPPPTCRRSSTGSRPPGARSPSGRPAGGDGPGRRGPAGVRASRRRRPRPLRAGPARTRPWRRTPRRRSRRGRTGPRRRSRAAPRPGRPAPDVSRRVASMPSMPGRLTSISTRSGRSSAATASDSSPDVADPTTTKPSVSSTTAAIARRNGSWSSTTRTRTSATAHLLAAIVARAGIRPAGGCPHGRVGLSPHRAVGRRRRSPRGTPAPPSPAG